MPLPPPAASGVSAAAATAAAAAAAAVAAAAAAAAAAAIVDVHGYAAANALTSPSMPPCCRLPNNSAALRCHFFVWEWGRGGKLFGKVRGVYFLKMELIRLYVRRVKRFLLSVSCDQIR